MTQIIHSIGRQRGVLLAGLFLATLAAIVVGLFVWRPGTAMPSPVGAPALRIETIANNFDPVTPGTRLTAEFRLHNDGGEDLVIQNVKSSCGCAPATLSVDRLAPGSAATLNVSFGTPLYSGMVSHLVRFETNDPVRPTAALPVAANVAWAVDASPPQVYFSSVTHESAGTAELELFSPLNQSFDVTAVEPSGAWVTVTPLSEAPFRKTFRVAVRPASEGPFSGNIRFSTSSADRPILTVPVEGEAVARFSVGPRLLMLGRVVAGKDVTSHLFVKGADLHDVGVEGIAIEGDGWVIRDWKWHGHDSPGAALNVVEVVLWPPQNPGYHRAALRLTFGPDVADPFVVPVSCSVVAPDGA